MASWEGLLANWPRRPAGDGLTTDELAEATGLCASSVRILLRAAARAGKLRVCWREARRIDGARCRVPVYQLVKTEKPGGKKKR